MQPISLRNPNVHKGPSTSREFNEMQRDIQYDITSLFNLANKSSLDIKENMDILIRDNFFMQNKIHELETAIQKIKTDLLYKEQGMKMQQLIKSFYSKESIQPSMNANAGYIDTLYGIGTLRDGDRVSKTSYNAGENERIIPSDLTAVVYETNNMQPVDESTGMREYYLVSDENVYKAFDGSNNSFWVRTSTFSNESNITEVSGILHIKLPLKMLNNIFANTLLLHPYPEYSMTIADIQYKGYGDTWYRLPNYPTYKDNENIERPVPIKNASKLMFSFPKTEVTEIQIFFTQPYWFQNEGKRDFVYGFQEIGVEHRVFNTNTAEFITEFSIEGTNKRFYTVESPVVVPALGSEQDIEELVEHKLYYSEALTSEFEFGNEILAPIQKIYIKTTLRSDGDVIPVIREIRLNYTYKDLDDI